MANFKEKNEPFIVCGHRGWPGILPENTLSGFIAAAALGVDAIEIDVVPTKDGVPVVCHDYMLERTSDGTGLIADYTLEELKKFDMGAKSKTAIHPEQICTVEDICKLMLKFPKLRLNLDMKEDNGPVCHKVADLIEQYGLKERTSFNGLGARGLAQMKDRGFYVEASHPKFYPTTYWEDLVKDGTKVDALCLNANQHVTPENVEFLRSFGVEVWAWCSTWDGQSECDDGTWIPTDCESCIDNLLKNGITMCLCNHPDRTIEILKKKGLR